MITSMSDLVCVTNRKLCREDFLVRLEKIAAAGPAGIILREKDLPEEDYRKLAKRAMEICQRYGVPCVLHSFVEVAAELGAEAIHVPLGVLRNMTPEEKAKFAVIGASCHSVEDAQEAEALGCGCITAGHVFDTDCKRGLPGRGLEFLEKVCTSVSIPVYAIGGIVPENMGAVRAAGAKGACVMSGLMVCPDPAALLKSLKEGR